MKTYRGFPCGSVVKNPPANTGDMGLTPEKPMCLEQLSWYSRSQELQLLNPHAAATEAHTP